MFITSNTVYQSHAMHVKRSVIHCCTMFIIEVICVAKTETQISIRMTNEFKARLEAQAQKERRSVSNLILKVMEKYLEQQENQA